MIVIKEVIDSNLQLSPTEGASKRKPLQRCKGFFLWSLGGDFECTFDGLSVKNEDPLIY